MTQRFQTIGLIAKFASSELGSTLKQLTEFLTGHGLEVVLDQGTAEAVSMDGVRAVSRKEIGEQCDLALVVGGDGTLLNAARSLAAYEVPLAGINMGRLGFLVDISSEKMHEKLAEILEGNYHTEERILLTASVLRDEVEINTNIAFNDVVIHKWEEPRMLEFETHINGRFVNTQRSDGLIIATPTGSTAYALSGGGPILHPTLEATCLVPICPHTLSQRPLAVSSDCVIEVTISEWGHASAQVTCDGQINLGLMAGDRIRVTQYERKIKLIHPADYNYYDVLRAKLHWGEKF